MAKNHCIVSPATPTTFWSELHGLDISERRIGDAHLALCIKYANNRTWLNGISHEEYQEFNRVYQHILDVVFGGAK